MRWDFKYLTVVERRGLLALLGLILILSLGSILLRQIIVTDEQTLPTALISIIEELDIDTKINEVESSTSNDTKQPLNPNSATQEELIAIGFSNYAAKSLVNYRSSGARFKDITAISKVYGMDSTMLIAVEPYLRFDKETSSPTESPNSNKKSVQTQSPPPSPINPNVASKAELTAIGFSTYAANSLIKYRSTGATFDNDEDIAQVYGVNEEMLLSVSPYLLFPSVAKPVSEDTIESTTEATADVVSSSFDPNTATYEELTQQGISPKVARTLLKFREKGARYNEPDDLLGIYGFSESLLDSLKTRIVIATQEDEPTLTFDTATITIDLSTATAAQLIEIRGIGPYLSKAIIEYRDKLGGYHSIEQLQEVPYFKADQYEGLKKHFVIRGGIKRLIPSELEFKELLKHPYTDYESTKYLFNIKAKDYDQKIQEGIKKGMVDVRLIPYLLAD